MAEVRHDDADIDSILGSTFAKVGESPLVIEQGARLQAMIDAARGAPKQRIDPTSVRVRFTRLKALALSAAHYELACQDDFEETLATRLGSGAHASLFEDRPVVCYDGRRQGKAWERFEKHHLELRAVILNEPEYRIAMAMVDKIRRHDRAMELLFDGTQLERSIDWAIGARQCRSTPDANAPKRHNTELKSTRSCEPQWFAREAIKRHYHAQLGFYSDAIENEIGARPGEEYIVAVENALPCNVIVMRLPDETRLAATKLVRSWWERLQLAEHTGHYGGYLEHQIDLDLPAWERDEGTPNVVEIDGKHVFTG